MRWRPLGLALVLAAAAVGCAAGPPTASLPRESGADMAEAAAQRRPAVVEVLPPSVEQLPWLDPLAAPQTPLGRLRARYLPVWTRELDEAFPPQACGTAWELDGIAELVSDVDVSLYGDPTTMAALAVMRYEHLVSRALSDPTPLAQLCVAVGSAGQARAEALARLETQLEAGEPDAVPHAFPSEVTILAVGPSSMLAVACIPDAGLSAYLLHVAEGREDRVTDISYRVARVAAEPAVGCSGIDGWAAEWAGRVDRWMAEGQAWIPSRVVMTAGHICSLRSSGGAHECPQDWRR